MEINKELLRKYIAIKLDGFKYYIWFKTDKIFISDTEFEGKDGWNGSGGAFTNIDCKLNQIVGIIYSNELKYNF